MSLESKKQIMRHVKDGNARIVITDCSDGSMYVNMHGQMEDITRLVFTTMVSNPLFMECVTDAVTVALSGKTDDFIDEVIKFSDEKGNKL